MRLIPLKNFIKILNSGMPQLLGLSCFLFVLSSADSQYLTKSLVFYQAALSIASTFFLGFAYSVNDPRFNGWVIALYYIFGGAYFIYTIDLPNYTVSETVIYAICFLCVLTYGPMQVFYLRTFKAIGLLKLQYIGSVVLPLLMLGSISVSVTILVLVALMIIASLRSPRSEVISYGTRNSFLKSLIFQSPFLLLQFFDPWLISVIGSVQYIDYTKSMKITNGVLSFIFSKFQYDLLSSDFKLVSDNLIKLVFSIMIIVSFTIAFINSPFAIFTQCLILSFVINLASLVIRSNLLGNKIAVKYLITVLCFFGLYVAYLILGYQISALASFFIFVLIGLYSLYACIFIVRRDFLLKDR